MTRHTRYQGLIFKDHQVLLIQHTGHTDGLSYWVIPGGGLDDNETEEECIIREMKEETNLDVKVERLIYDGPAFPGGVYKWLKTYLCSPVGGIEAPGFEPEPEAAANYKITSVRWFDLRDEMSWGNDLLQDQIIYSQLTTLRDVLGYTQQN